MKWQVRVRLDFKRSWLGRLFLGFRDEVVVGPDFQVCLDCGMARSAINPALMTALIEAYHNRGLRDRLGFLPRSPMADADLDGPPPATKGG